MIVERRLDDRFKPYVLGLLMLSAVAWLLALPVGVMLLWLTAEIVAGLRPFPIRQAAARIPRTTVLIPAHNEAAGIASTVLPLAGADPAISILVVADNCTDATVQVAREVGAEVIERQDDLQRGKGFALAFGRNHLAYRPADRQPEAVIVLDADCRTDIASIRLLAQEAVRRDAPVQARNLLVEPAVPAVGATAGRASPITQLSNFAMLVKNLVRARGLQRLGGGIPLFGTGMAFPWRIFARAQLATDHLVEDMQLALDLAKSGIKVSLLEQARVESAPAPDNAMAEQRGRWERGFIGTALSQGFPMLLGGIANRSRHRAALGLHLMVPPLALLLMLGTLALSGVAVLGLLGQDWLPALTLAVALFVALVAVASAWLIEGRATLTPCAALEAPFYILWKIPLYLGFLSKDRRGWTRTRRAGEND